MAIHKIDGVDAVDGGSQISSFPKKFVTLYAAAAITKGDWVRIDLDDSTNGLGASVETSPSTTAAGDPLVFGVATETITAAGNIRIQTAGKYGVDGGAVGAGAEMHTGVGAGVALVAGNAGTAGQIFTYASGTHTAAGPIGISLVADGAGDYATSEGSVMIFDQGLF